MPIQKIISGGQTGADQGGLAAGKLLGLETGGYIPKGFRTQSGPRPNLAKLYNLLEDGSASYPSRTKKNVQNSDATLIFGNGDSLGCQLTIKYCRQFNKPFYIVGWSLEDGFSDYSDFDDWLKDVNPKTLNVAGNREESQPGIHVACREFLVFALTQS